MWKFTSGYLITWYRLLPSRASVHLCVLMVLAAVQGTMGAYKLPVFIEMESNVTANKGSEAVLTCGARHLGTKQIIWKKADGTEHKILTVGKMVFTDDTSIAVQHQKDNHKDLWNLVIKDVTLAHSGLYECQISTQEDLKRYIMLNVLDVKVPYTHDKGIVLLGKGYVEKGDAIELTCNITGDVFLSSDVDWFKNGKTIHPNIYNGIHVHTTQVYETRTLHSVLTIDHSSMDDMGIYVCRSNAGSEVKITSMSVMVLNGNSSPKVPRSKSGEMYINSGQSGLDKTKLYTPPIRNPTSGPDDNQKYQRDIYDKAENNQNKRDQPDPAKPSSGASRLLSKTPRDYVNNHVLYLLTFWLSSYILNLAQ